MALLARGSLNGVQSPIRLLRGNSLWISWIIVGALSFLCALLAIIQGRWIEQIGNAQRQRLQTNLQNGLTRLGTAFDQRIASSCAGLIPSFDDLQSEGTEAACTRQYALWKKSNERIFRRIGILQNGELSLLDFDTGTFVKADWPADWGPRRDSRTQSTDLIEFHLFGTMHRLSGDRPGDRRGPPPGEEDASPPERGPEPDGPEVREDSLLAELDTAYLAEKSLPDLISQYLEQSDSSRYDAKIVAASNVAHTIAATPGASSFGDPDGSIAVFDPVRIEASQRREGPGRGPGTYSSGPSQPQWRLLVHRRDTSVDSVVSAVRWRNFAVSGGILLLIVTMVAALVHYSRRANQLALLQMNFVAGVSHDLRTPLTVIRTAAYNLRGRIATRPEQVEKYGQLIQRESEKLSLLVEQVLRYNAANAGHLLGERVPIAVGPLIESSLESSLSVPSSQGVTVEKSIPHDLPLIDADELAVKHALQNLFDNAVKYGLEGSDWIGVSAKPISAEDKRFVEIQVSDRGPGIPAKELSGIFDAFVRGERAVQDHIHGTGLGLNLVKRIVEAHGGAIRVVSEPAKGASFILRLPAASEELQNEFANTIG